MSLIEDFTLSIIIPCHNEEGNINVLYHDIRSSIDSIEIEFIFIDDCSTDDTLDVIKKLCAEDKAVKYISFSKNFGHQSAIKAGIDYATGDCVVCMDADMQHPPNIINKMIVYWKNGYEVVYSIRKNQKGLSFGKRITSHLYYLVINGLSDTKISHGAADFRLLDRKVVEVLKNEINEYHLFYRGLINWLGFKKIDVEYTPDKRFSGQTKYSYRKMMSLGLDGLTSFSVRPLKFAILLGLIISFIAAIYAIYILYVALFTDNTVKGWTSVILSVLFIGGVNMVLLGIIGEYLGKIFVQVKNRPHYIIRKSNFR